MGDGEQGRIAGHLRRQRPRQRNRRRRPAVEKDHLSAASQTEKEPTQTRQPAAVPEAVNCPVVVFRSAIERFDCILLLARSASKGQTSTPRSRCGLTHNANPLRVFSPPHSAHSSSTRSLLS